MADFFYEYKVYFDSEGLEHTLLKWFNDGEYAKSNKIDKPTSDLTRDDIIVLLLPPFVIRVDENSGPK